MLLSELPFDPAFGLLTTFQEVPVQCSIRVLVVAPTKYWPTAQTLRSDSAVTAVSRLSPQPGFRLVICTQLQIPDAVSRSLASAAGAGASISAVSIGATQTTSLRITNASLAAVLDERPVRPALDAR